MRILIFTYLLGSHFGPGKQIAILAGELKRLDHQVVVFCQTFVPSNNQYRLALQAQGVPLYNPGNWAAENWQYNKFLRAGFFSPQILQTLGDALAQGQTWANAWSQARARVYQLRLPDWTGFWATRQLDRLNRESPFDLIHNFSGLGAIFAWASQHQLKLIYNENIVPSLEENWWEDVRRWAPSAVNAIISVCAAAEPEIRAQFNYQGPIEVIPPMVVPPPPLPPAESATGRPITFGVAARLHPPKGHEYLIRAIHHLKQHYPAEKFRLLIAGDGGIRGYLENLTRELHLENEITFLGGLDSGQMEHFWSRVDVFVLPSLWEGVPVVILEAMAHAKPVIATDIDGVVEAVQNNHTGLLVPPANVEALAAALARLAQEPQLRQTLGQAGHERFQAQFSPQVVIPQYLNVYRQVITAQKHLSK